MSSEKGLAEVPILRINSRESRGQQRDQRPRAADRVDRGEPVPQHASGDVDGVEGQHADEGHGQVGGQADAGPPEGAVRSGLPNGPDEEEEEPQRRRGHDRFLEGLAGLVDPRFLGQAPAPSRQVADEPGELQDGAQREDGREDQPDRPLSAGAAARGPRPAASRPEPMALSSSAVVDR